MKSTSPVRASFSAVCLLLLAATPCPAQEAELSSLRLVNATGAKAPLLVRLNGEALQARGYRSGEATGQIELAAGSCHIELTLPLVGSVTLTLKLQPCASQTVVAVLQSARDEGEPPRPPNLACHVLAPLPPGLPTQHRLRLLQVTPLSELDLRLDGRDLRCRRLQEKSLLLEQPNPVLEHAGRPLGRLPFEEAGDGTLILFTDEAGDLRRVFFLEPAGETEPTDRE